MGDLATPELRQAIGQAIDKQAIADQFLEATASSRPRCCRKVTGPHRTARIPTRTTLRGAAALSEAGFPPSIEISTAAGSSAEPIAQVVQSQLQAIGVNATLKPLTQVEVDGGFRAGDLMSYEGFIVGQADPALR